MAPVRGAEPRARRAAHVVPPGGQGRQPRRRPGQEQEAAAGAPGVTLPSPEEAFCGGSSIVESLGVIEGLSLENSSSAS